MKMSEFALDHRLRERKSDRRLSFRSLSFRIARMCRRVVSPPGSRVLLDRGRDPAGAWNEEGKKEHDGESRTKRASKREKRHWPEMRPAKEEAEKINSNVPAARTTTDVLRDRTARDADAAAVARGAGLESV